MADENKNQALGEILQASMDRVEGYGDIQTKTSMTLLNPPTSPAIKETPGEDPSTLILYDIHNTLLDMLKLQSKEFTKIKDLIAPNRIRETKRSSEGISSAAVGESLGIGATAGGLLKGGSIGLLGFMAILPVLSAAWLEMRGGEISEKFKDLTDKMRAFFLGLGSFGLAPLLTKVPVVGKVFSQIGSFFQSIGAAFNMPLMKRFTDGAAGKTGSIITKFASTIGILLKPFSIIIRPALALARAIPGFGQALTAIIAIFDGLVASVKVLQEGGSIFDAIKAFFVGAIDGFFNSIVDLIDLLTFGLIPDGFIDAIKDPFARIMPLFEAAAKPMFDVLENLGDFFKSIFEGDLLGAVNGLASTVSSVVLMLPNQVLGTLEQIFPDFIGGIRETMSQIQDWVMGKVNALNPFAKSVEEQNIEMVRTQREGRIQAEADERFGPMESLNRRERGERNRFIREREREMNREIRSARRELGDEGASDLLVRQERHEMLNAGLRQNVTVVNNTVDNSSVMNQQSNISGGGGSRASAQNPVMAY